MFTSYKNRIFLLALGLFSIALISTAGNSRKLSSQQSRLLARRAAIADAQRLLAETIYGVKIDARTTVRNYVAEKDEIHSSVRALLRGARVTDTRYEKDGSCTVRMEVPVALLQKALRKKFAYTSDVIRVTGRGAPNKSSTEAISASPVPEETWHTLIIKATGMGTAPKDMAGTPQGRLMAERAAYLDALRQLGENIMGVKISSTTTVRNYITTKDAIKTKFEGFVRGARRVETRHGDDGSGVCEVDLEIPLKDLPGIIKPQMSPTPYRDTSRKSRRSSRK